MIDKAFAQSFAAEWIAAWNSHDLDRILSHYAEDFEFSSPFIFKLMGEASSSLEGHSAVRAYWSKALALLPDLHFQLISVYAGVSSIVIHYQRRDDSFSAEFLQFGVDGKIHRSSAHYVSLDL